MIFVRKMDLKNSFSLRSHKVFGKYPGPYRKCPIEASYGTCIVLCSKESFGLRPASKYGELLCGCSALLPVIVAYSDWWLGHWRRSIENLWIMRKVRFAPCLVRRGLRIRFRIPFRLGPYINKLMVLKLAGKLIIFTH